MCIKNPSVLNPICKCVKKNLQLWTQVCKCIEICKCLDKSENAYKYL